MQVKDFKVKSELINIVLPYFFYITCNLTFITNLHTLVFFVYVYLFFC